jgi:hypothetical protein
MPRGQPRGQTWHPGSDKPLHLSLDGNSVAYVFRRETDHRRSGQLFHTALTGGFPEKQMEEWIFHGSYSEQGDLANELAFIWNARVCLCAMPGTATSTQRARMPPSTLLTLL